MRRSSLPVQKGSHCRHRFVIAVAVDVVTSTADMHHLTMLPDLCCFLGNFRCDYRVQLRITRNEQDGALDARNHFAPGIAAECCCMLQYVGIKLGFGVGPGDDLLFDPIGIHGEGSGKALLMRERLEIYYPLPRLLALLLCIRLSR